MNFSYSQNNLSQAARTSVSNLSAPLPSQPEGTLFPGTIINVKQYTVTVQKYLAEGGFAHVYLSLLQNGQTVVLKRLSCPDETTLRHLVAEAETHVHTINTSEKSLDMQI
jgi:hypothetical protein